MRIYVASSWRNPLQPGIVHILRRCGHGVYDFRHPSTGNSGFSWSDVDPEWQDWSPEQYREALKHPIADLGYQFDIDALRDCEAVVYVLPCGRSASWEFGYAMGQGKKGYVVMFEKHEPELMFKEAKILTSINEFLDEFLSKEREQEINNEDFRIAIGKFQYLSGEGARGGDTVSAPIRCVNCGHTANEHNVLPSAPPCSECDCLGFSEGARGGGRASARVRGDGA